MHDDELDRLLSDARRDLPTPGELAPLSDRLGMSPPKPTPSTSFTRPFWLGGGALIAAAIAAWMTWTHFDSGILERAPATPPAPVVTSTNTPIHPSLEPISPSSEENRASRTDIHPSDVEPARPGRRHAARVEHADQTLLAAPPVQEPVREESEVSVMQRAISAHRAGNREAARAALVEHRARFPEGLLAEERSSLEVELMIASDPDAARVRLEAFRLRYPSSGHLPRLERLLR